LIVGLTTIVPSPICFAIAFVFVTSSLGIFGLTVPRTHTFVLQAERVVAAGLQLAFSR